MTATDGTRPGDGRPQPDRSRLLLWAFGGLLLVALAVGAVAGAARRPAALEPGSPEAVVQSYLAAVLDSDYGTAARYLSDETAERCPASMFREVWVPDDLVADLDEVRLGDARAEVRVQVRSTADPLPFEAINTSIETFVLIDEEGAWRITDDPWPLFSCTRPE